MDPLATWSLLLGKLLLGLFLLDLLVLRLGMYCYNYWYYKTQGIPFVRPQHPILGNFLAFSRIMRNPDNYDYIPWQPMLETLAAKKDGKLPEVVGIMMQSHAVLVLNTPQPFTDLYV